MTVNLSKSRVSLIKGRRSICVCHPPTFTNWGTVATDGRAIVRPVTPTFNDRINHLTDHPEIEGSRYELWTLKSAANTGTVEWQHVDDATAAATHHAHISTDSRDCDGGHGYDYVAHPNVGEEMEWSFTMWMRVCESTVSTSTESGTLTTSTNDDGERVAEWRAPTEEGYEHRISRMCSNPDCAWERGVVYDQFAQLAGY